MTGLCGKHGIISAIASVVEHLNFVLTNGRGQTEMIGSHFTKER